MKLEHRHRPIRAEFDWENRKLIVYEHHADADYDEEILSLDITFGDKIKSNQREKYILAIKEFCEFNNFVRFYSMSHPLWTASDQKYFAAKGIDDIKRRRLFRFASMTELYFDTEHVAYAEPLSELYSNGKLRWMFLRLSRRIEGECYRFETGHYGDNVMISSEKILTIAKHRTTDGVGYYWTRIYPLRDSGDTFDDLCFCMDWYSNLDDKIDRFIKYVAEDRMLELVRKPLKDEEKDVIWKTIP